MIHWHSDAIVRLLLMATPQPTPSSNGQLHEWLLAKEDQVQDPSTYSWSHPLPLL